MLWPVLTVLDILASSIQVVLKVIDDFVAVAAYMHIYYDFAHYAILKNNA